MGDVCVKAIASMFVRSGVDVLVAGVNTCDSVVAVGVTTWFWRFNLAGVGICFTREDVAGVGICFTREDVAGVGICFTREDVAGVKS